MEIKSRKNGKKSWVLFKPPTSVLEVWFGQILFNLVRTFAAHHVKNSLCFQVCIDRLFDNLESRTRNYCFLEKFWNFYPNICANSDYENSTKGTNNYPFTADHYYGKVLDALLPAKRGFHISLIGWKQARCSSTPLLRMGLHVRKTWATTHRHVLIILGRATARFM